MIKNSIGLAAGVALLSLAATWPGSATMANQSEAGRGITGQGHRHPGQHRDQQHGQADQGRVVP